MNIYLDESYNLQKNRGKMFISINGFLVQNERSLLKEWKQIRKPHLIQGRRVHAADSKFEELRILVFKLLKRHHARFVSVIQENSDLSRNYFDKNGVNFEMVYTDLLKKLLHFLALERQINYRIVIDARKKKGGPLAESNFRDEIISFLFKEFPFTPPLFYVLPSYFDILLELADFVSNSFFRQYQENFSPMSADFGENFIQIKNPLPGI